MRNKSWYTDAERVKKMARAFMNLYDNGDFVSSFSSHALTSILFLIKS